MADYSLDDVLKMAPANREPQSFTLADVQAMRPAAKAPVIPDDAMTRDARDNAVNGIPQSLLESAKNLAGGAVRGSGSIGATILSPYDWAMDKIMADRGKGPSRNDQRRSDMDSALQSLGADPNSFLYGAGKLGAEIAGTAGVGGGLAQGARALGAAAKMSPAAIDGIASAIQTGGFRAGPLAGTWPGVAARIGGGAVTGGATAGLINPDDAAAGAVIGGALPPIAQLAGKAGAGALSMVQPFYDSGKNKIIGNALINASGNQAPDVLANLTAARQLVPGSLPTAPEAAQNSGISALARAAIATDPIANNEMTIRQAANNMARVNALQDIAGSDGARDFHDAARQATAKDLYERAFSVPIEMENLSPSQRGEITKLLNMPAVQDSLVQARTNAANFGMDLKNTEGNIAGLHQAKLAMDDKISALMSGTSAQKNQARAVMAARDRLVTFMEAMSPDYQDARTTYQQMSKPINQMDIAQKLLDKSVNPLNGSLYPNGYARALTDDTAKAATGFKGASLEGVMDPAQLQKLTAIRDDLARKAAAESGGRGVGSNTVQNLAYANMLDKAGIPNFMREWGPSNALGNILGRGLDLGYKRANNEMANRLALSLLDPKSSAELMRAAMNKAPKNGPLSLIGQTGYRLAPLLATQDQ